MNVLWAALAIGATAASAGSPAPPGVRLSFATGRTLAGALLARDQNALTLEIDGGTVEIPLALVERVEFASNEHSEFRRREAAAGDDAKAHWELARWARQRGLSRYAELAAERVLTLDPDHAEARLRLGYSRFKGSWLPPLPAAPEARENEPARRSEGARTEEVRRPRPAEVFVPARFFLHSFVPCRPERVEGAAAASPCGGSPARPLSASELYRTGVSRRLRHAIGDFSHRRALSYR